MSSLKERTKCVICRQQATAGSSLRTTCGHWTHNQCMQELGMERNYQQCAKCLGLLVNVPIQEPVTPDGRDYVLNPPSLSAMESLRAKAAAMLGRKTTQTNAFELLAHGPYQMPVESIIQEHGLGLQHLIRDGVTIDDFLQNGYTLDDLQHFQDLSGERGPARARQALCALKMTADHIRDGDLPYERLRDEYEIGPREISTLYGLQFPEGGYVLSSPASEEWTAQDVLKMGYSMQDLIDHAGMEYVEQYIELQPTAQDEALLAATQQHIDSLMTLDPEVEGDDPYEGEDEDEDEMVPIQMAQPRVLTHVRGGPIRVRSQEEPLEPLRAHHRTRHCLKRN